MLDFICMGTVDLPGARRKRQNTKSKISCPQWDSNPQPFDSKSDALPTELAGLGECYPFKWPYYIHVFPILMYTLIYYKYENDKGQRILSGKCTVVCYIWNIIYKCCKNSKETHKSCACFQHANTAKHSTILIWYLHVESKHRTYASLCYL